MLNDITFVKGEGGLGKPLPGEDHISGLVIYNGSLPSGFGTTKYKRYLSLAQAEADGITEGDATWGHLWYQLSEFFRLNKQGVCWVYIDEIPVGDYDFAAVTLLQQAAEGKIRQCGVWVLSEAFTTDHVEALEAIAEALDEIHMPISIVYGPEISGTEDVADLLTLRNSESPKVSVLIAQDGGAAGAALATSLGKSVPCLGALLGAISAAKVHESIAWVGKFDFAKKELEVIAFSNGQLLSDVDSAVLVDLNTKSYLFLRKHVGITGSYFNDDHCAVATTSDYSYISANRTIDKAIRNVRTILLPQLNGPVNLDSETGRLTEEYVEFLKALGDQALTQMAVDGELSGYKTIIDPTQDVLGTGIVEIAIQQVQTGVARNFKVNIGFVKSLS